MQVLDHLQGTTGVKVKSFNVLILNYCFYTKDEQICNHYMMFSTLHIEGHTIYKQMYNTNKLSALCIR